MPINDKYILIQFYALLELIQVVASKGLRQLSMSTSVASYALHTPLYPLGD
jgi:hypothetical protein